ncbi:MAG: hypothetical protein NVV62_08135 [Terricaulis sp.]|nr:hypothetical protein [Terricaulis sp.]
MKKGVLISIALLLIAGAALFVWQYTMDPRGRAVAGEIDGAALVLRGKALRAPDSSPEQTIAAANGSLGLTVLPNQPPPTPAERGVRILISAEHAARINDRPVLVEVDYALPAVGAASGLAVSLQGIAPADWISQPLDQTGRAHFELPAQIAVDAIGLRALSNRPGASGAISISEIRILPGAEPQEAQAPAGSEAAGEPPP